MRPSTCPDPKVHPSKGRLTRLTANAEDSVGEGEDSSEEAVVAVEVAPATRTKKTKAKVKKPTKVAMVAPDAHAGSRNASSVAEVTVNRAVTTKRPKKGKWPKMEV